MKIFRNAFLGVLAGTAALCSASPAVAITVAVDTSATSLAAALLGGGGGGIDMTSVSASLSGHSTSSGTYANASNTYGIGPGIVISSGNVSDYGDGPNTSSSNTTGFGVLATAAQQALLFPIDGKSTHYDVTQLNVAFDMLSGYDTVYFNVTFGSDEYAEYAGSTYIDAFGLYVNGANIAFAGGNPINIDNPMMAFVGGTELDGILAGSTGAFGPYVHTFSAFVGNGAKGNTMTFIIADSGDDILDSTAYISQLGGTPPPSNVVPEPGTWLLMASGLAGLAAFRKKFVRQ